MKSIKKEDIKDLSYKDITNIILENNKKARSFYEKNDWSFKIYK